MLRKQKVTFCKSPNQAALYYNTLKDGAEECAVQSPSLYSQDLGLPDIGYEVQ